MRKKMSNFMKDQLKLTEEEKKYYETRKTDYLKASPYLKEPLMSFMLHQVLLMEIRMMRLNAIIADTNSEKAAVNSACRALDALQRTYAVYGTRMGQGYISRERRKEGIKKQSPLEKATEEAE
jgi:hypothetical protein